MISNAQKSILHIAKGQLGLDRDQYEGILYGQGGVRSSSDLTNKAFDAVMRRLEELGFTNTARANWKKRRPLDPVTPEQQTRITELYNELGWAELPRRMGFNRRCCKKSWPQTRNDGIKVIEGLKAMLARVKVPTVIL